MHPSNSHRPPARTNKNKRSIEGTFRSETTGDGKCGSVSLALEVRCGLTRRQLERPGVGCVPAIGDGFLRRAKLLCATTLRKNRATSRSTERSWSQSGVSHSIHAIGARRDSRLQRCVGIFYSHYGYEGRELKRGSGAVAEFDTQSRSGSIHSTAWVAIGRARLCGYRGWSLLGTERNADACGDLAATRSGPFVENSYSSP